MNAPGPWPGFTDYSLAIQRPAVCFADPELRSATIPTNPLGMPLSASGANAIVFPADIGDRRVALRCFTNPAGHGRRRYESLHRHVRARPAPPLAEAVWHDDAITIEERTWPLVRMEWVEGVNLDRYVGANVAAASFLVQLADDWWDVVEALVAAEVAHGDLQHGNVMIDTDGRIRLIDFDAVWVPGLDDAAPDEVGHPAYQHPERLRTAWWGATVDTFPAVLILCTLRALAAEPRLWELHAGDNLVLTPADLASARSGGGVWAQLAASPDAEVARLARLLTDLLGRHPAELPDPVTLLGGPPGSPPTRAADAGPAAAGATRAGAQEASAGQANSPAQPWWATAPPEVDPPRHGEAAPDRAPGVGDAPRVRPGADMGETSWDIGAAVALAGSGSGPPGAPDVAARPPRSAPTAREWTIALVHLVVAAYLVAVVVLALTTD